MSEFRFYCPFCQYNYMVDSSLLGSEIKCPNCTGKILVPKPVDDQRQALSAPNVKTGAVCPYCRTEILTGDRVHICRTCETPHHEDCWNENKGCTVYGCIEAPPEEEKISVTVPPSIINSGPGTSYGTAPRVGSGYTGSHEYKPRVNAPGATSALVYGIVGFFCCALLGIAAIIQANKAKELIRAHPDHYTGEGMAKAGYVLGIIQLIIWGLSFLVKMMSKS